MKTSAFWEMHSSHADSWNLAPQILSKIYQTIQEHPSKFVRPWPSMNCSPEKLTWNLNITQLISGFNHPNHQTSNFRFQTLDFPWRIIAMQPNEIWLLARWATRIDELARSLRAAFSLGAGSSRVTSVANEGFKLGFRLGFPTQNVKYIWMFPKIWVPQNGWFIMENSIKMDDLGVPLFLETPIYIYIYLEPKWGPLF